MTWILLGRVDLGLLNNPTATPQLHCLPVYAEDLHLVGARGRPLAGTVRLRDLHRYPLILPARPHPVRNLIDEVCSRRKVALTIAQEIDTIEAILQLIQQGFGYGILARNTIPVSAGFQTARITCACDHQSTGSGNRGAAAVIGTGAQDRRAGHARGPGRGTRRLSHRRSERACAQCAAYSCPGAASPSPARSRWGCDLPVRRTAPDRRAIRWHRCARTGAWNSQSCVNFTGSWITTRFSSVSGSIWRIRSVTRACVDSISGVVSAHMSSRISTVSMVSSPACQWPRERPSISGQRASDDGQSLPSVKTSRTTLSRMIQVSRGVTMNS